MENAKTNSIPKGTVAGNRSRVDDEEAVAGASEKLGSMTLAADDSPTSAVSKDADKCCASCGKTGPGGLKRCTACKSVWYCGVNCQIDHRKSHKKECKRIKKELAARQQEREDAVKKEEKYSLFNPKPRSECPICMVVMPPSSDMKTYMQCCGKTVCSGCVYAHQTVRSDFEMTLTCPFCRSVAPESDAKVLEGIMTRVESGDADAMAQLSLYYDLGECGLPVDPAKALELRQRSADAGCIRANKQLGDVYGFGGYGLLRNLERARLHYEFAAKRGDPDAQINLGLLECDSGNFVTGFRLFRLAAQAGQKKAVDHLTLLAEDGRISKEEVKESEKVCNKAIESMRTEERDKWVLHLKEIGEYNGSITDLYHADC